MKKTIFMMLAIAAVAPEVQAARGYFDECPALYRMVEDPEFIAKVAGANGLTSVRFYSTETPEQMRMILAYGNTRNLCGTSAAPLNETAEKAPAGRRKP